VRSALATLVAGLAPPDLVALVPTSGRRDQRVEFTRDKGEVRRAIGRLRFSEAGPGQTRLGTPAGPPGGIDITGVQGTPPVWIGTRPRVGTEPPSPSARAGGTDPMLESPEPQAEGADDRLLTTLADVSTMIGLTSASRAMVVLVSSGLPVTIHPDVLRTLDQTDFLRGLREPDGQFTRLPPWEPTIQRERRMEQTVRLILEAQRGGVTVYAVNPLHLDRVWSERLTAAVQQEDARQRLRLFDDQANPLAGHPFGFLGALSAATGGVTFTGVLDPEAVARALIADSGRYYLVRYYPTRQSRDTRLRAVEVRVRRTGITVRSRGRYATLVDREAAASRVLDPLPATLGEVLPRSDLHLEVLPRLERAGTGGRPTHVRLLVRIVPDGASWSAGDRYDVQAVAIDGHGRARATATGSFEAASALPETPRGGHFTLGPLAAGRYQIRLAVHDVMRDRAGSVFVDVTVP
jgi:VWFA-related protein